MKHAPYRANVYVDLTLPSVALINTLSAKERRRIQDFLQSSLFKPSGRPPTDSPWVGDVPVDEKTGSVDFKEVHRLANRLIADWNSKYTLQMRTGTAGPNVADEPRNETWRWEWVDGKLRLVTNYTLVVAPDGDGVHDPLRSLPDNPGLTGRFRFEIEVDAKD